MFDDMKAQIATAVSMIEAAEAHDAASLARIEAAEARIEQSLARIEASLNKFLVWLQSDNGRKAS